MTNREKFKEVLNEDFNKAKNYKIIMEKGEKMNNKLNLRALVPLCTVLVIFVSLFTGFILQDRKMQNSTHGNKISNPIYVDKEKDIVLNINSSKNMISLMIDADIKTIPQNGINLPWPDFLVGKLALPNDLTDFSGYAVYTRENNKGEYDQLNCYVYNYTNEKSLRDVQIAFSQTGKPLRDYYFNTEGSLESNIGDTKLTIYKYQNVYFTEFSYKGYNFDIETSNLTEAELKDLLVSIIN